MGDKTRDRELFFSAATQYFIAGRFAAAAKFIPIYGNLLHHAVEMYLKGYLSTRGITRDQLRTKYKHKLKRLWNRFKKEVSDPSLDRFDTTISKLDRFEAIRYPDRIADLGMIGTIAWREGDVPIDQRRPEPHYGVVVRTVDSLVREIFRKSSVNPLYFARPRALNRDALIYLRRDALRSSRLDLEDSPVD